MGSKDVIEALRAALQPEPTPADMIRTAMGQVETPEDVQAVQQIADSYIGQLGAKVYPGLDPQAADARRREEMTAVRWAAQVFTDTEAQDIEAGIEQAVPYPALDPYGPTVLSKQLDDKDAEIRGLEARRDRGEIRREEFAQRLVELTAEHKELSDQRTEEIEAKRQGRAILSDGTDQTEELEAARQQVRALMMEGKRMPVTSFDPDQLRPEAIDVEVGVGSDADFDASIRATQSPAELLALLESQGEPHKLGVE